MNVAWTWNGLGWPDDGQFQVYVSSAEVPSEILAATVPGPGRSVALTAVLPAADISYYCRVVYVKDATVGTYSAVATGNPY